MLDRIDQPHTSMTLRMLVCSSMALIFLLALFLLSTHGALAHNRQNAISATAHGPTLRVNVGFDARFRDGNWMPINVSLTNDSTDFTGVLSVNVPNLYSSTGSSTLSSIYQQAINLPSGAQKQVTMYVPFNFGSQGTVQTITVNLLDSNGHVVQTQASMARTVGPGDIFIGILSDQPTTGFSPLSTLLLPDQTASILTQPLNATTMPTIAEALNNFELIILDHFTTSSLSKAQMNALEDWVNQGGNLIEIGGPEWHSTLSPLPANLLPASVSGIDNIPAGTHLLPFHDPLYGDNDKTTFDDTLPTSLPVSTATAAANSNTLLSSDNVPLIVRSLQGQGQIYYLAYDPTLDPLVSWSGATTIWKTLLLRTLGDQILAASSSPGTTWTRSNMTNSGADVHSVLQSLFPNAFPATWLILLLLAGYLLVLGPIRLFITKRVKSRDWSWRIILSTIAVFSLLSYGLALQQKGTSVVSSSISVIQLNASGSAGSRAHTTTYVGLFVPNQGDFHVHIPGFSLVQPTSNSLHVPEQSSHQPPLITTTSNGVDTNLQSVNIWTMRTLISKTGQQFSGGIVSHLQLHRDLLTGTVTNQLPYTLRDAYVLISGHVTSLGTLAPQQTKEVHLLLKDTPNDASSLSLADQIANSKGLPIPYNPNSNNSQAQNETQRHMALLVAVSGGFSYNDCADGPPCFKNAVIAKAINSNGYNLAAYNQILNGGDPLLLPNATATLIGWADHMADASGNITINGTTTSKIEETLVQAPLDTHLTNPLNLSPSLVQSQLIDVQGQGNNIQTPFNGIYTLSAGTMTFDFTLPNITDLHAQQMMISAPTSLPQVSMPAASTNDANHLHAYLYNRQTNTWDPYSFNAFKFSTNTPMQYIGSDEHVLLQLTNPNNSQGTTLFGRPSLQLTGSTAR
ncbi:MAG: hypothetical protein E6J34_04285 [Chloroflexi bacterium]|nr:MAG: hypothetical protein E6J34_04285 [Chloroflexota bacterium]